MKNHKLFYLILSISIISFSSCKHDDDSPKTYKPGTVTMEFENVVGNVHVDISGAAKYVNAVDDSFNITKLKYYISNVQLLKSDGTYYIVPDSYYLIDESDTNKHHFEMDSIPGGIYTGVKYTVGVDSARNVSGAQTGALDPANGMYWSATDGYIFLNMEGTSASAISGINPAGNYVYHIGGFKSPYNAIHTLSFPFGVNFIVDGTREAEVHNEVNLLEFFMNPWSLSIGTINNVDAPGNDAFMVSNDYADMFAFEHVHND